MPLNLPELLRALRMLPSGQQELQRVLRELEHAGQIARIKGNRYIQPREADLIPGWIQINRQGKGFLHPDDAGLKEIVIPESATSTALHEDRVLVRRDVPPKGLLGDHPLPATGTVVRVLERRRTRIVGTLERSKQFLFVIPDDPRLPHDIYVPEPRDLGRPANVGDKVVVELREWLSRHTNPEGRILEVLGNADAEGVDMLSVLRQYHLPTSFPKIVQRQAEAVGSKVAPSDLRDRADCRGHRVITIDPDDAKDFDDAICLERLPSGQFKLWVHIADVSHYVKTGSALDVEARQRGNSTYLVDRVIPMLPEALSNELCSLQPHVDRLTKCVEFLLSEEGRVQETKFYPAVIHSQRRYSYQEVLGVLQRKPVGPIELMLHDTHQITQKIRRARFKAGSLALDFPEMKIRLDERGRVARIERQENDVSHQLIEECMLLANEAVAERLMHLGRPAVYRIHEPPDALRLQEYRKEVLSHNVPCGDLSHPPEVQRLLHRLDTMDIGPALKIGFLKSLMRARYAVEPLGHYGLAKAKYTHFTSPIRRYADLAVHRALFDPKPASSVVLREMAAHVSTTERNSADAERDSKDVKLFAFLKGQLRSGRPEQYPALVTDVRNFGFFVDVPGLAMSGLVPLSTLEDDFYTFDAQRNHVMGRRTRRVIRLGDRLTVQVAKVDRFKKQVDFRLAQDPLKAAQSKPRGNARPSQTFRPSGRSGDDKRTAGRGQRQNTAGQSWGPKPQARPSRRPGEAASPSPAQNRPARRPHSDSRARPAQRPAQVQGRPSRPQNHPSRPQTR